MRNLYNELFNCLCDHGKEITDIVAVTLAPSNSMSVCKVPVAQFLGIARTTVYDAGYGAQEINETLTIYGESWWITRGEYDGSEWFEWHEYPQWEYLPLVDIEKGDIKTR